MLGDGAGIETLYLPVILSEPKNPLWIFPLVTKLQMCNENSIIQQRLQSHQAVARLSCQR